MKKLFKKLLRQPDQPEGSSRITSDTIEHHRERILAEGRKFKYPIQYARHKLVYNAIIISVVAVVVVVLLGWWQLFIVQNTSDFMYRITKVIPVPIASVDGQLVPYSDYLMKYLSSVHYLEQKEQVDLRTEDGKRQADYYKQQVMDDIIADSYAAKLATSLKLLVSDAEVEAFLNAQKQSDGGEVSDKTYESVIADYFYWSPEEYRYIVKNKLLRQKVAYQIDQKSLDLIEKAKQKLNADSAIDLKSLADYLSGQGDIKIVYGTSGWVSKFNQDGGLSAAALKLAKNGAPDVVKSTTGDGYYIIRLLDINDSQVSYEFINVPLTQFDSDLRSVIDNNKVQKFINI